MFAHTCIMSYRRTVFQPPPIHPWVLAITSAPLYLRARGCLKLASIMLRGTFRGPPTSLDIVVAPLAAGL